MKRPTKLALAVFAAVCLTLPLRALYQVNDTGLWPKELEPLRKQARTLAHDQFVVYEIPFTIEIELIVDGDIADLNRIRLPADTSIIDKRF